MFPKTSRYYDAIYAWKDYKSDVVQLHEVVTEKARLGRPAATLLDVACGTGMHLAYLQDFFEAEGLDLDQGMLNIAGERLPDVPLHGGSMNDFDLGKCFDVVTCLFSSIGAMTTFEELQQAICCMARHTNVGGLVIVEPWIHPDGFYTGGLHALYVDQPELKIARMNISAREGDVAVVEFHYLIGTPEGISSTTESLRLGLFTHEQYLEAFAACGLQVDYDEKGLNNRGMYIGLKEPDEKE
jgi:ubiquinone/menaquinone biosynthesis C-methylase UbiE